MVANLSQKLELRAVDSATGEQLGHLQQNVVSIVRSGGELSGTLQLSGSQNGSVELKMHFRHVSPHTHGQSGYVRDIDDSSTSVFFFHEDIGGMRPSSVSSRFGSKLPQLC